MRRREFIALVGGAALCRPTGAYAQHPPQIRRVGVLMSTAQSDAMETASIDAFVGELAKLGWRRGQNLEVNIRWGEAEPKRMAANAAELVALNSDVLLAKGAQVPAARQATTTIPIIFVTIPDAVAQTYVGAFSRPTGNTTGFTSYEHELIGKRLGLLRDLAPRTTKVLYVRSRQTGVATQSLLDRLIADARALGLAIVDAPAENGRDIESAVQAFAKEPDGGLIVAFDAFTWIHRPEIVELAARYRLPTIYPARNFSQSGGLCSYGFDQDDQFRQAANYVARIFAGAMPSDLPVQTPTKFDLVVNKTTAKNLGLTIPQTLLATADDVIE